MGGKGQQSFLRLTQGEILIIQNDAWFQEKYNPEVLDAIERERKERVCKNAVEFINLFKEGAYDNVDFAIKDYVHILKIRTNWASFAMREMNNLNSLNK
jgi:cell division GTPase FtsZ